MTKRIQSILILTVAFLVYITTAGLTSGQAQTRFPRFNYYSLNDIGASTIWSFGYAINNAGQAVGDMTKSTYSGQISRAFRTSPNQPINIFSDDLGVLGSDYRSYAYGINSSGVAVGDSTALYTGASRAFRFGYNGAGLESLHTGPITGATQTFARGISDYNWIVGYYKDVNNRSKAMLTFGPGYTYSIDAWGSSPANLVESEAYDVNNSDQIAGWHSFATNSWMSNWQPRAFRFDIAGPTIRFIELDTLPGGIWSKAFGLNDSGVVVGQSDKWVGTQRWTHAFLWKDANNNAINDPGEMQDIDSMGTSYSAALGINNAGVAVGYYGDPNIVYGGSRAAIFINGTMSDLNGMIAPGSGWILRVATGINDNGQIVGWMEDMNTDQQARVRHAFRIDPPPPIILQIRP